MQNEQAAFPVTEEDLNVMPMHTLYTSSVEMVTTPYEHPIWRTRKPVVVVIHHGNKAVQHHYYRYLVVSPGGDTSLEIGDVEVETDDEDMVSTSNERTGSTAVMQWEDPFDTLKDKKNKGISTVSLASSITGNQVTKTDYRNLPYRSIDIDVKKCKPVFEETDDEVRLDHWNMPDDASFKSYLIREAVSTFYISKKEPFSVTSFGGSSSHPSTVCHSFLA